MRSDAWAFSYTRAAAMVTMAFYAAGHAAVGFAFFFVGALARVVTLRLPLWRRTVLDAPLLAFGIVLVLSTTLSTDRSTSQVATLLTVVSSAVFFGSFAWLVGRDAGVRTTLLQMWALGGPPAAVVGMIAGWIAHDRAFFPRMPMGTNAFATTLCVSSLMALGCAYRARGRERQLWFVCALVSLVGLLATESRSGLAGWVAGAIYLSWRELRSHPRHLAAALVSGIVVLAIAAGTAPSVASRVGHASSDLVADRVQIWRIAVGIVESYPLLGTGPGTFQTMFNQRKALGQERKWSAHNLWLHYTVETGLLGLLCIVWTVFAAAREWMRSGRLASAAHDPLRPAIVAAAIGLLVDQCGDNTLLSVSTMSGAWLLLALMVVPPPRPDDPDGATVHPRDDEERVPAAVLPEAVLAGGARAREGSS